MSASAEFNWTPQPAAAAAVAALLRERVNASPDLRRFGERLLVETGTRLIDWVDTIEGPVDGLAGCGFVQASDGTWSHPGGIFPAIRAADAPRLYIRVERLEDFVHAQELADAKIEGEELAPLRRVRIAEGFWAVERHGSVGLGMKELDPEHLAKARHHAAEFRNRKRTFDDPADGFDHARRLIDVASSDLGVDVAADLFFAGERAYWESRNAAGRLQKSRQDALGLGWANHDHHTYRSGREHFTRLVATLEAVGMECRERFYAGEQAGWGAQVMEHPVAGVAVFADVDLAPEEVAGDFAHDGLAGRERLGTVGLWCRLHGEAMLEAGMHHLEGRFDFEAARGQLAAKGVASMKPFTNLPYLKQSFTEGEQWKVAPERIEALKREGRIDDAQAGMFLSEGALGSHMEILQRDDGYKGFNQEGVSEIIRDTDPRKD